MTLRQFDPRATARGVRAITPLGVPLVWRVKSIRWYDEQEADRLGPDHHIMVDVLDEQGRRLVGVPLLVTWPSGEHVIMTEEKPGEPYSANYPMSPSRNEFSITVDGLALSEVVSGIGMGADTPGGFNAGIHTSTAIVFQRATMPMSTLHLPHIHVGSAPEPQAEPLPALRFAELWMATLGDKAADMRMDQRLTVAAQLHADYLANRTPIEMQLSPHIGSGHSFANERVLAQGYRLPGFWPTLSNSVESYIGPIDDVDGALAGLLNSPPHRAHLLREGWFGDHSVYGVGYAGGQWVILGAPPESN